VRDAISFTNESSEWEIHKVGFQQQVKKLDKIRNENFENVFPELKAMLDE
jgi:hypothetical protein